MQTTDAENCDRAANDLAKSTAQSPLHFIAITTDDRIADSLRKLTECQRMNAEIQRPYREAKLAKQRETIKAATARIKRKMPKRFKRWRADAHAVRSEAIAASRTDVSAEDLAAADALHVAWKTETDWLCGYCGKPADPCNRTTDHVIPLTKGGKHQVSNLKRACRSCNSRKSAHSVFFA